MKLKKKIIVLTITVVTLLVVYVYCFISNNRNCFFQENNLNTKHIYKIFPVADRVKKIKLKTDTGYLVLKNGRVIGITAKGKGWGYKSNIVVEVGVHLIGNNKNKIKGIHVIKHYETRSFFNRVNTPRFRKAFIKKELSNLPLNEDDFKTKLGIDTVAGATLSSIGILTAVKAALYKIEKLKTIAFDQCR